MTSDPNASDGCSDTKKDSTEFRGVPVCANPPLLSSPPQRVLVTGANGFVGSHLVEALVNRGDRVTCLVRSGSQCKRLEPLDVQVRCGDVTDPESLKTAASGHEVVYHVAGVNTSVGRKSLYDVNARGVHNVVEACAAMTTPPVLVVVSSLAAAGPARRGKPRTECDPCKPVSHYGRSKLAGERAAAAFADRVPVTIVRPPIVVGEAATWGIELFQMIWRYRLHVMMGLGRHQYSLVHAADLARLMILAATRGTRLPSPDENDPTCQGYYFAACDRAPTFAELGRLVASALDRRVLLVPSPPRAIWPVAAIAGLWGRLRRNPGLLDLDKARGSLVRVGECGVSPFCCCP